MKGDVLDQVSCIEVWQIAARVPAFWLVGLSFAECNSALPGASFIVGALLQAVQGIEGFAGAHGVRIYFRQGLFEW